MKKRRTIVLLTGAFCLLAGAIWLLSVRTSPQATITGHLQPEDPAQIQRAISHYRWMTVRTVCSTLNFKLLFSSDCLDLLTSRVREVGAGDGEKSMGARESVTNPPSVAYAIYSRGQPQHVLKYFLERTTNGWIVVEPVMVGSCEP